jgi:hypothetical protein
MECHCVKYRELNEKKTFPPILALKTSGYYKSTEKNHQGSHHGSSKKLGPSFVFLCEAIHPKDWLAKDAFKLSTTKVSIIRWRRES